MTATQQESEPRIGVNVRVTRTGLDEIDRLARAEDRSRSQMIRVLLAEAITARRKTRQNIDA